MEVPAITNPKWKKLFLEKQEYNFEFLAVKMLIGRQRVTLESDHSEAAIQKSIQEVYGVFEKNKNLPKVQRDLAKLFGQGGK